LRHHRAVERFLQRLDQLFLAIGLDIKSAIFLRHAHEIHDAARSSPGEALIAEGDDVDGELVACGMKLLGEFARRPPASLLSVGDDDHDARLGAEIERLRGRFDQADGVLRQVLALDRDYKPAAALLLQNARARGKESEALDYLRGLAGSGS